MASQVLSVKSAILDACALSAIEDADAGQQATLLRAFNAAVQHISVKSPASWHRVDEWSGYFRAPTLATFTGLTTGTKAFTWSALSSNSWALNCAARLASDVAINRIQKRGSTSQLLLPYIGSDSSDSVTIYNDVIETPDDFLRMKGDLTIIGKGKIYVAGSNDELGSNLEDGSPQEVGIPTRVRLVSRFNSVGAKRPHLKLDALPSSAERIYAEYYARPLDVTSWTEERQDLVPMDYVMSVLIPVVLQKVGEFTTLITDSRLPGNQSAYEDAMMILSEIGDAEGSTSPGRLSNALE